MSYSVHYYDPGFGVRDVDVMQSGAPPVPRSHPKDVIAGIKVDPRGGWEAKELAAFNPWKSGAEHAKDVQSAAALESTP